jgi:hypothetical protein
VTSSLRRSCVGSLEASFLTRHLTPTLVSVVNDTVVRLAADSSLKTPRLFAALTFFVFAFQKTKYYAVMELAVEENLVLQSAFFLESEFLG